MSALPTDCLSRLKVLTAASVSTQVSLLDPPRCIEMTRAFEAAETRVSPPGITTWPLGVAATKTRRPTPRGSRRRA
jgi:hypothetical protein